MFRGRTLSTLAAALLTAALTSLGACNDQRPTEPLTPAAREALDLISGARLVECKTDETQSSELTLIGPEGGVVAVGGTTVTFPAGLLTGPANVRLTIPASRYVEIAIETDGEKYFTDVDPTLWPVITIDYSRCSRSDILTKPLSAWYIDSDTKALLEQKPVLLDNKLLRRITFTTDHFSGYAIAF